MNMKAILIGATGATGSELLKLLLADEAVTTVTALVRKSLEVSHPKLNAVVVDFNRLDDYSEHIFGDVAFSCLGTTLKAAGSKDAQYKVDFTHQYEFAKMAKANNIPKFLLISSSNADEQSMFFYSKMKAHLENAVEQLNFNNLIIFRPGPLERPHSDRKGEKLGVAVVKFFNAIGLFKEFTPLKVVDLARLMLNFAKKDLSGKVVLESADILLSSKS